MGEIDIQPKKRPVWPWILAILAAIIIIWIIIRALDADSSSETGVQIHEFITSVAYLC